MSTSLCIVGGCGHVGLPLGIAFARAGAEVTLLDTDKERVRTVSEGQMPFVERGADQALAEALASGRLKVTTDQDATAQSDVVIITIGTPLDEFLNPHVLSFDRFIGRVLDQMRDGQLLVLRSTVYPTVTDRLGRRVKERGLNIDIANCPERIAQGYALEELTRLPQLIGGVSEDANRRARELFELLGARTITIEPIQAELAKLFANAYRYINFAISNQFYMIASSFGTDFHRIHEAVTADYPRLSGFAGAGFAGGPCLLKDTMQLAAFNHNAFGLGHAAMLINEDLPSVVVRHAKEKYDVANMTAAILGMAFKGNNDDHRDSLAYKLRKVLVLESREVICSDPYIQDPSFVSLEEALERADIIFIGAMHREYRELAIEKPLVDVFNFVKGPPK